MVLVTLFVIVIVAPPCLWEIGRSSLAASWCRPQWRRGTPCSRSSLNQELRSSESYYYCWSQNYHSRNRCYKKGEKHNSCLVTVIKYRRTFMSKIKGGKLAILAINWSKLESTPNQSLRICQAWSERLSIEEDYGLLSYKAIFWKRSYTRSNK